MGQDLALESKDHPGSPWPPYLMTLRSWLAPTDSQSVENRGSGLPGDLGRQMRRSTPPASAPVAPSRPRPFEFLPDCLPLARMLRGHHACHPGFSHAHETRGDRLLSSLLPATRCEQISG